jgi:membrane protein required for beta-lactamase induction
VFLGVSQLHQLEDEEEALLFHHRLEVVMAVAKYLLVLAPFAAFAYALIKQAVPVPLGPFQSALVRLRIPCPCLGSYLQTCVYSAANSWVFFTCIPT